MNDLEKYYNEFKDGYVQTMDDLGKNRQEVVSCFPAKELKDKKEWLLKNNKKGMCISITPNPCEGGRKAENVKEIKWVYVDMDSGTKEEQIKLIKESPFYPNIIVESKRSYHLYWRVDCDRSQFDRIISGLILFYDGDPALASPNSALRMPGFYHAKDIRNLFKVQIVRFDMDYKPTPDEMMEAYPIPKTKFKKKHLLENDDLALIKDIPIKEVLQRLGVEVSRTNFIIENGQPTSASVNIKGNYINRFSGKPGSGSVIDVVMEYGSMEMKDAIKYLREGWGIEKPKPIVRKKQVEAISEIDRDVPVFTWGTPALNKILTPIQQDHFIILAGSAGAGKTTFAFDVAYKNALEGKKVLFLSLEMSKSQIEARLARGYAGITKEDWRDRNGITEEKKRKYKEKAEELKENKTIILKGFSGDVKPTTGNIFQAIDDIKPDFTVIDNFDLVAKDSSLEYSEQNRIAKEFMDFCHETFNPVIMIHHLNPKNKNSGLGSMRGSGKIGDNCDTAIFCSRNWDDDNSKKDNAKFMIRHEKDRDFGQLNIGEVYFYRGAFYDEYPEDENYKYWQNNI